MTNKTTPIITTNWITTSSSKSTSTFNWTTYKLLVTFENHHWLRDGTYKCRGLSPQAHVPDEAITVRVHFSYPTKQPGTTGSTGVHYQDNIAHLYVPWREQPFLSFLKQRKIFVSPPLPKEITEILNLTPAATDIIITLSENAWRQTALILQEEQMVGCQACEVIRIRGGPGEWTAVPNGFNLSKQSG